MDEPPLKYHYLKRPYTLIPATTTSVPHGRVVGANTAYEITLRPGIRYAPHPCFARESWAEDPSGYRQVGDFRHTGTRELRADDYALAIRRLADPTLQPGCPILPIMAGYIVGLEGFAAALSKDLAAERARRKALGGPLYAAERDERDHPILLDLIKHPLPGVVVTGPRSFRLTIKGRYPQILYWLAMPFFAPVPAEALAFYGRGPLVRRNLTLARFPVGTGPFRMETYEPDHLITLVRNENWHGATYPMEGEPGDRERGLLQDAGAPVPFVDRIVKTLEKESIPRWIKFQQGYYDGSGVPSEAFDQAAQFSPQGAVEMSSRFKDLGFRLETEVELATFYFAFNMLDDTVGGYSDAHRRLRQAIAIAVDTEERIQIFANGLGVAAQGFLPPGMFGHEDGPAGVDQAVYAWDARARAPRRRSLTEARKLLAAAGYPGGRGHDGRPLEIRFDNAWNDPEHMPVIRWLTQKIEALGLRVRNESTDYNRFQEKASAGNFQMLAWGWLADYPDPENFMFLMYGPNGKAKHQGENVANYDSAEFNSLFKQFETMENSPARLALIRKANGILRNDAPLIWGLHPVSIGLYHAWVANVKAHAVAHDSLAYIRLDPGARDAFRLAHNRPVTWPLVLGALATIAIAIPSVASLRRRRERRA